MGIILGGSYPGWELSGLEFSWMGIFWVGVFLVPNDASTKSDQNVTKDLWIAFACFLKNLKIYCNLPPKQHSNVRFFTEAENNCVLVNLFLPVLFCLSTSLIYHTDLSV